VVRSGSGRYRRTGGWSSGRRDQQVKIRGHRIELGEIEPPSSPSLGGRAVRRRSARSRGGSAPPWCWRIRVRAPPSPLGGGRGGPLAQHRRPAPTRPSPNGEGRLSSAAATWPIGCRAHAAGSFRGPGLGPAGPNGKVDRRTVAGAWPRSGRAAARRPARGSRRELGRSRGRAAARRRGRPRPELLRARRRLAARDPPRRPAAGGRAAGPPACAAVRRAHGRRLRGPAHPGCRPCAGPPLEADLGRRTRPVPADRGAAGVLARPRRRLRARRRRRPVVLGVRGRGWTWRGWSWPGTGWSSATRCCARSSTATAGSGSWPGSRTTRSRWWTPATRPISMRCGRRCPAGAGPWSAGRCSTCAWRARAIGRASASRSTTSSSTPSAR